MKTEELRGGQETQKNEEQITSKKRAKPVKPLEQDKILLLM